MMFSMAEESFASCKANVSIRIVSFGMLAAAPFNSANARCDRAALAQHGRGFQFDGDR
jgi:hypothetical protein